MELRACVYAAALAAFALAASAGCSRPAQEGTAGRSAWTRPGVLRIGETREPATLLPEVSASVATQEIGAFLFSYAIRFDDRGRPVPDALAEVPRVANGDVSRDGLTLRYKLRRTIRWQDGVPLTCADLRFTWQVIVNPANRIALTDAFSNVASIDCSDPFVAVVHMKRVYAPFLARLWGTGAAILPEHLLARYNDAKGSFNTAAFLSHPVGSGPFELVSWRRGEQVRMKANPAFYLGKPKLDEVDFRAYPDDSALENALRAHEIDLLAGGPPANWPSYAALARDPGLRLVAVLADAYAYVHVDFNLRNPVLADVDVRRALAAATDRKGIARDVAHGAALLSQTDQNPALSWAYTDDFVHRPYDPAAAAALLEADGWRAGPDGVRVKNGRRFEFVLSTVSESSSNKAIELLLQQQWRAAGAAVTIKNEAAAALFAPAPAGAIAGGHYDAALFAWSGTPDPDHASIYSAREFPPRGENSLFWNDPAATAALDDALSTVDDARRNRDYAVVQRQLALDVPTIVLYFPKSAFIYSADLRGFTPSPATPAFWNPWAYAI